MVQSIHKNLSSSIRELPSWFKQDIPDSEVINNLKSILRSANLHTVCEGARCPNMGQCWAEGVATFMIMGDTCTRACRFCAVESGSPELLEVKEPLYVAQVVKKLALSYVVITSVTRDDLPDGGAGHFARTINRLRGIVPNTKIEVLIPDFENKESSLMQVVSEHPDVISHNIETSARLFPLVRPQADYSRSLDVLRNIKKMKASIITKSGFMVGLGETKEDVAEVMKDLLSVGCDMLTIGQYLSPSSSSRHVKIHRFVVPDEFEEYKRLGLEMGFKHVFSAPLVRSSYVAEQGYRECLEHSENCVR